MTALGHELPRHLAERAAVMPPKAAAPSRIPKSLDDINTIGTVTRILYSMAALKTASQGLGINADPCGEVPPAARFSAVLNAAPSAVFRVTANGPM